MKIETIKSLFLGFKGYSFIRLNIEIENYQMFKKSHSHLNPKKSTQGVYLIGPDSYSRMVKNKHEKLETGFAYVPSERTWGKYLDNEKNIVHHVKDNMDKYYLQVFPIKVKSQYLLDGKTFNPYEYSDFLLSQHKIKPEEKVSKSQGLNGLDIVRINDISIENISLVKFNGKIYL